MILARLCMLMGLLFLAACGTTTGPVNDTVSGWRLQETTVRFGPEISRTADGNTFSSNFVWTGLNDGNRKRQVRAMFEEAMQEVGDEAMTGVRAVDMNVQINYFHALTEYSRLWCCGVHRIRADLTVTDAGSGEVLAEGKDVSLGRLALGGIPGLVAQEFGRDQWVRVKEGIVKNTRRWLEDQQ